jgi:hypothetical protein
MFQEGFQTVTTSVGKIHIAIVGKVDPIRGCHFFQLFDPTAGVGLNKFLSAFFTLVYQLSLYSPRVGNIF